jgi:malate dehydrogenase (oxaloacetate-decarboxylating)
MRPLTAALDGLEGVEVRKVSDRAFLLHLGGKIEVTPTIPLRNRDKLSRAYTPGASVIVPGVLDPTVAPAVAAVRSAARS